MRIIGRRKSQKKQAGLFGLGVAETVALVAFFLGLGAVFIYPMIKNFNESAEATRILGGFVIVEEAVRSTNYATEANFTGLAWDDLVDFLPEGFLQRASNGSDYDVAVNSDNTKYDTSLTIADNRVMEKVKAKLKTNQYTVTGTKITLTGP